MGEGVYKLLFESVCTHIEAVEESFQRESKTSSGPYSSSRLCGPYSMPIGYESEPVTAPKVSAHRSYSGAACPTAERAELENRHSRYRC